MKFAKSILLASATAFVSFAASAADLPKKSAPAPVCGFGAGFMMLPGTDTCLKIGGFVRMDVWGGNQNPGTGFAGNNYGTRSRAVVNFDARSNTSMGVLRSYAEIQVQRGGATTSSPDATIGSGNGQTNRSTLTSLNAAFIQFAGITAGFTANPFYMPGYQGSIALIANQVSGGYLPAGPNVTQLAYTAAFGGGLTATVGLVDALYTRTQSMATAAGGVITAADPLNGVIYGGNRVPDVVANINFTQGWGSAQLMGATHHVIDNVGNTALGYAFGGGLRLNLGSPATTAYAQVVYAKGANVYAFDNGGSDGLAFDRQSYTVGSVSGRYADAITTATGLSLTQTLAVHGSVRHAFSSQFQAALFGGYAAIDATATVPANGLSDIRLWNVGANVTYTPVANLNLSLEAIYYNMKSTGNGGAAVTSAEQSIPAVGFRIQRNF